MKFIIVGANYDGERWEMPRPIATATHFINHKYRVLYEKGEITLDVAAKSVPVYRGTLRNELKKISRDAERREQGRYIWP